MTTRIQISESICLDIDDISICKRIAIPKLSERGIMTDQTEPATEVVMKGDKQIYHFQGKIGDLLWQVVCDGSAPLYNFAPDDDLPF